MSPVTMATCLTEKGTFVLAGESRIIRRLLGRAVAQTVSRLLLNILIVRVYVALSLGYETTVVCERILLAFLSSFWQMLG